MLLSPRDLRIKGEFGKINSASAGGSRASQEHRRQEFLLWELLLEMEKQSWSPEFPFGRNQDPSG